jgi:Flp pilus assembly protein TadG
MPRRQAGQSLTEFALALPVMLLLLLGAFNIGVLLADKVVAAYATRQGARLAAELGNGQGTLTTSQIDQQIVSDVTAASSSLTYASIREVDIYAPRAANGVFNSATDEYDSYDGSGTLLHSGFPGSDRVQVPPNETSIGIRVVWQYSPPTGSSAISVSSSEYTVMKASPVLAS